MGSHGPEGHSNPQEAYENRAITELRAHGLRITKPRIEVVKTLAESTEALSPYAIHARIKGAGGQIDVVSVYRILETLEALDLVHHVGLAEGYRACGLDHSHASHSQHVVCRDCRKVVEIDLPDPVVSQSIDSAAQAGFHEAQVKLEILATCDDCENKSHS